MAKRVFTLEFKHEVLKAWEEGTYSLNELAIKYNVNKSSIIMTVTKNA